MSLIGELGKIIAAGKRQYQSAKGKPLLLLEEIRGREGDLSNMVCRGDNKVLMKTLIDEKQMAGSMQLIYIDPPFYSRTDYDAVVQAGREKIRHPAYGDRWEEGMAQYLKMLSGRLRLMRDLLSETGLIWLHLDWHVVHYAKVIMDEIFGEENFINEIIWTYKSGGSGKRHFSRKHDTLLVYSKTKKYAFYPLKEKSYNRQFKPYRFKGVKEYRDDAGWYTLVNMKDVWQIDMVGRTSSERTGYATQKPEQLLERILQCCTREGDLCADFFCGSGTLPAVASRMKRRFIGCDIGNLAVESTVSRLAENGASFSVYDLDPPKASKIRVKIDWQEQEIPASDKVLLKIKLISLREKNMARCADEKSREKVREIQKEDSLQLVCAWSLDLDYQGGVHRPEKIFARKKGILPRETEQIVSRGKTISVKISDIFGNVTYERIETGNEREPKTAVY